MIDINKLNFSKLNGLVPACIQNSQTLEVLMIGFMNKEALYITLETNKVTFWSRSKNRIWVKGESSGNYLNLIDIKYDCDRDSLLLFVDPVNNTCHRGYRSCFGDNKSQFIVLQKLLNIIRDRSLNKKIGSYTSSLFEDGVSRIAQKVGEEGVEVALAAVSKDVKYLREEITDLVFHLLVLMQACGVEIKDVTDILKSRMY
jgi:phosphoribosyl-ATP pyrophosphohydrolase/phosphoribosyl-AMP cyclohydrolase